MRTFLAFLALASVARADLVFTFSQIPDENGTRLSVSGNGVLDGLNTNSLELGFSESVSFVSVSMSTAFSFVDYDVQSDYRYTVTPFSQSGTPVMPGSFSGNGIAFNSLETLIDYGSNGVAGVGFGIAPQLDGGNAGMTVLVYAEEAPVPGTITLNTGYSLDLTALNFGNFQQGQLDFISANGTAGSNTISFVVSTDYVPVAAVPEPSAALYGLAVIGIAWAKKKILG